MDLSKLCSTYDILLQHMKEDGYSEGYIKEVEYEVKWIKRNPWLTRYSSYVELCEERVKGGRAPVSSQGRIYHKRSLFTLLKDFEENEEFPNRHRKVPLIKRAAYYKLNGYFKKIVDEYSAFAAKKKHSKNTIAKCVSKTSCFLLHLQNQGHINLETVTESNVIAFFTDEEGKLYKSRSCKRDIESVLSCDDYHSSEDVKRVLLYLPAIKKRRKNIQHFTLEESISIRDALEVEGFGLSKKDKAKERTLFSFV